MASLKPERDSMVVGANLIGSEWEDKDVREIGRVIQLVAVEPNIEDGYGGPVFRAICTANRDAWKIGRQTMVGEHGLRKRWRRI